MKTYTSEKSNSKLSFAWFYNGKGSPPRDNFQQMKHSKEKLSLFQPVGL